MVKCSLNLSDAVFQQLTDLARARETTLTEIVRDALSLEFWVEGERAAGGRILVERGGTIRELVVR